VAAGRPAATPPAAGLAGLPLGGLKTGLGVANSQKAWLTGFSYADGVWLYNTGDGGPKLAPGKITCRSYLQYRGWVSTIMATRCS